MVLIEKQYIQSKLPLTVILNMVITLIRLTTAKTEGKNKDFKEI